MNDPRPPYKGTMMFRVLKSSFGWSESLWINKPTYQSSLDALEELATRRIAILPEHVRIEDIRVTNPELPRASNLRGFHRTGTYVSDKSSHLPWTVLIVRLAFVGYHTNYSLGGIPRDVGREPRPIQPTPEWQAPFNEFAEGLKRSCVMVNVKHMAKGSDADRETVINPIESVNIMRLATRKRGMGHSYPRGRRARAKT